MSMIKAIRDFLATCPYLETFSDDIGINYLGTECDQFSVTDIPSNPVLQTFYDGSKDKTIAFAINSRSFYSENLTLMSDNSAIFENISGWIESQSRSQSFPNLGSGKEPYSMEVTSSTYLVNNELSEAVYQIQCRLDYYEPV